MRDELLALAVPRGATLETIAQWVADVAARRWTWTRNTKCKYVVLHIDTRSGAYRIQDRDGNDITEADLLYQFRAIAAQGGE